jgi:hypothetical protein
MVSGIHPALPYEIMVCQPWYSGFQYNIPQTGKRHLHLGDLT